MLIRAEKEFAGFSCEDFCPPAAAGPATNLTNLMYGIAPRIVVERFVHMSTAAALGPSLPPLPYAGVLLWWWLLVLPRPQK